jgi:hypothetical protein
MAIQALYIVTLHIILEITMARIYEGTVRIIVHPVKGVQLTRGVKGSTLTAADADKIASLMVDAAKQHKVGIDRWSFYIPEVNQKLATDDKHVPLSKAQAAIKDDGYSVALGVGNWGSPKLIVAPKVTSTKKQSNIIEIA